MSSMVQYHPNVVRDYIGLNKELQAVSHEINKLKEEVAELKHELLLLKSKVNYNTVDE